MWKRWNELNSEFQEHKKTKKDSKKMSATIIKHQCNYSRWYICKCFIGLDKFLLVKISETGFYSLPTGKLHKKSKQSRLKNFPTGYVGNFYRNLAYNVDNFLGSDFYE